MPLMRIFFLLGFLLAGLPVSADEIAVAKVVFVQGTASAAASDGSTRFLALNDPLREKDIVSIGSRAFAVIQFVDGTSATLRPGTVLSIERFRHAAPDGAQGEESAWLRLVKGGLRIISGLISKKNPGGERIIVPTATIGIRGTNFDVRLCGDDCREEENRLRREDQKVKVEIPIAARVIDIVGMANSISASDGKPHPLYLGSPLYAGDHVETTSGYAVLAFTDGSRVTVRDHSRLIVEKYNHGVPEQADSFVLRLLRGGLRAVTGLIGKLHPEAVSYRTKTSTIGIRGTGVDISCEGPCANDGGKRTPRTPDKEDGLFVLVWDGAVNVGGVKNGVSLGQIAFIGADGKFRLLKEVPPFLRNQSAPRPDQLPIDLNRLFGKTALEGTPPGLYVAMRDGLTEVDTPPLFLSAGEAGYKGADGEAIRLDHIPLFMELDDYPLPDDIGNIQARLIELVDEPGIPDKERDLCEIR